MGKQRMRLWGRLRYKYKLIVLNQTTDEKIFQFRLSLLYVLTALGFLGLCLVVVTVVIIAFTNLREFIPGYPDKNMRRQISENNIRIDSIAVELDKRDAMLRSFRVMLGQESDDTIPFVDTVRAINVDTVSFNVDIDEQKLREAVEEKERFNLGFGLMKGDKDNFSFFVPVDGIVTRSFDEKEKHYGTDIVAKTNSNVKSILDGVVIFTDWTIKTGYVIQVQHSNNFVSIYKHNSVLLKAQGDYVRGGEVIGIVGNSGEETTGPHLHFELWRAGTPLNPEDFIKFKL